MTIPTPLADVAHVIQLAIAPVFLLTAVATLLNVLTGRLGRAVDRRRKLFSVIGSLEGDVKALAQLEFDFEVRRIRLVYISITSAVICALLVAGLISLAFIDALVAVDLARLVGAMFVLSMLALMTSLSVFLREIFIAVNSPRAPIN